VGHSERIIDGYYSFAKAMGVGRIFSGGGHYEIFPNFFWGGPKLVKFVFPTRN